MRKIKWERGEGVGLCNLSRVSREASQRRYLCQDRSRELEGIKVGYYTKQEEPSKGWAQAIIVERSQGLYQKMKGKKNNIRIWYKSNYCGRKTQKEKKYQLASCAT